MNSTRKDKTSWTERVSALLKQGECSSQQIAAIVKNSPYEDEIRKGLRQLREAELLTQENQIAVILAGREAAKIATALESLSDNFMLSEKSVAAVLEVSQYADLFIEKLLSYRATDQLTDESQAAAVQAIKSSQHQAMQTLSELMKTLDFQKIETVIELAKACVELKPFSCEFLKTLSDQSRYDLIIKMLNANAVEQVKLFKELVKVDPALLMQMDSIGQFPLMSVIQKGDINAAKLLLECGADPNQTLGTMTAMAYAKLNRPELFKELQQISKLKNANDNLPEFRDFYFFNLGQLLGYPNREKGVCFGYCLMAMQAFLLSGDEPGQHPGLDEFYQRIARISEISPEKHLENLQNARKKIQDKGSVELAELTENEKIALSLPALYEDIEILHRPMEYRALYEKGSEPNYQTTPELSLKLTASKELEEQGGVASVRRFSGVYQKAELIRYFEELKSNATAPVALLLCSREADHNILVTFDPASNQFILINPGNAKDFQQRYYFNDITDIAKKTVDVLAVSDRPLVIGTTVFSAAANQIEADRFCDNWLMSMQDIQKITPEKAQLKLPGKVGWVEVAQEQGEVELVKKLLDTENTLHGYQGRTLFMKQRNDAKLIEETKKINTIRQHRS